jgi:hypothetical protein
MPWTHTKIPKQRHVDTTVYTHTLASEITQLMRTPLSTGVFFVSFKMERERERRGEKRGKVGQVIIDHFEKADFSILIQGDAIRTSYKETRATAFPIMYLNARATLKK